MKRRKGEVEVDGEETENGYVAESGSGRGGAGVIVSGKVVNRIAR